MNSDIAMFEIINGEKNEMMTDSSMICSNVSECEYCGSHELFNYENVFVCEKCNMEQKKTVNSSSLTDNPFKHWNISFFSGAKLFIKRGSVKNKKLYNLNRKLVYKYHDRSMYAVSKKLTELLKKNQIYDEAILFETIKIFSNIKLMIKNKENLNRGLIAMCFYYTSKDRYVVYSQKELSKLFDVDIKFVSSANNKINRLIAVNSDLKKMINKKYLTIKDYFYTVKFKFPEFNKTQLSMFKHALYRISSLYYVKINVPKSIIGGMIKNFIIKHDIQNISDEKILDRIGTSPNSLYKYKKTTLPLIE